MKIYLLFWAIASATLVGATELPAAPIAIDHWTAAERLPQNLEAVISQKADGLKSISFVNPRTILPVRALPPIIIQGIGYVALSFGQPERLVIPGRWQGIDADWIRTGLRRQVKKANQPPGQYQFRAISASNDVRSANGAGFEPVLRHLLWQLRWFILLAGLILIAGVMGAFRRLELGRVRREMETLVDQLAVTKERARIARDIHDDLGARLTQIGLLSELARRKSATPEETLRQVDKIVARTRTAVQAMDEIVWAVDPTKDTLDQMALYLAAFVRELFEDTPISCHLDLPDFLPAHPLSAEARHNLLLVVKEAFHNTLKHSNATEAGLRLTIEDGFLTMAITDNGKGFERASVMDSTVGNGLKNMQQRLRSIGGEFDLESCPDAGTHIRLRMKLS